MRNIPTFSAATFDDIESITIIPPKAGESGEYYVSKLIIVCHTPFQHPQPAYVKALQNPDTRDDSSDHDWGSTHKHTITLFADKPENLALAKST